MKTNFKLLPLFIFMAVAVGVLIGGFLNFPAPIAVNTKSIHKNKLNKLITFIDSEYVDAVDTDSIVDLALSNILDKLDPHSVYIPKEEQSAIAESMKGDFVGVGINFYMYNDSLAVINTVENGPSQKAGILAGDRILAPGRLPGPALRRIYRAAGNRDALRPAERPARALAGDNAGRYRAGGRLAARPALPIWVDSGKIASARCF